MARVEIKARHPQNPTARWAKFQEGVRKAAVRSAEQRARRDRERQHGTDYARTEQQSTAKG